MDTFYYFFCSESGEREEESEAEKVGGYFLFGNREGGRVSEEGSRGGAHWGWEVSRGLGEAKYFFSGPRCPPGLSLA